MKGLNLGRTRKKGSWKDETLLNKHIFISVIRSKHKEGRKIIPNCQADVNGKVLISGDQSFTFRFKTSSCI